LPGSLPSLAHGRCETGGRRSIATERRTAPKLFDWKEQFKPAKHAKRR
jgi:hypothetical protein